MPYPSAEVLRERARNGGLAATSPDAHIRALARVTLTDAQRRQLAELLDAAKAPRGTVYTTAEVLTSAEIDTIARIVLAARQRARRLRVKARKAADDDDGARDDAARAVS